MIETLLHPTRWPAGLDPFIGTAHEVEVKTVTTRQPLRPFLAGFFSYRPAWMLFLFWLRGKLVPLIGLKGHSVPPIRAVSVREVPFEPGKQMAFFTVKHASPRLWVAGATERHLTAHVAVEKEGEKLKVYTLVTYHHWTGRVYYALIRPFHHLVVNGMIREGLK